MKEDRKIVKIQALQSPAGQGDPFGYYSRAETGREEGLLWVHLCQARDGVMRGHLRGKGT